MVGMIANLTGNSSFLKRNHVGMFAAHLPNSRRDSSACVASIALDGPACERQNEG